MCSAKKKAADILMAVGVILLVTACSAGTNRAEEGNSGEASEAASHIMEGTIEVEENLPDRDISVPDYLRENKDEGVGEEDFNQDESGEEAARHLTGKEQTEKARQVAEQIEDSINQVLRDKEYYPHVTGISVNSECTEFNVTFSDRNLSLYENVLPVSLCIVGDRFQLYQGGQENELMTVVNYVDEGSGEVFNTISSKDIK